MNWIDKYEILLQEELITKDMKTILGVSDVNAKKFRVELIIALNERGIELADNMRIPTELFLEHINKDLDYFKEMAIREVELKELKRKLDK